MTARRVPYFELQSDFTAGDAILMQLSMVFSL